MPSRNIIRSDVPASYYHLYARGSNKEPIFLEAADYSYFEKLLIRYLSIEPAVSKTGVMYPNYNNRIDLLAYCLMPNHFHLLVYQQESGDISKFMSSLMTSYSRYFNLKYNRTGSLFESRYKSARIDQQNYLEHISRYIHLNPRYWQNYPYSSLKYYKKDKSPEWLHPEKIVSMFNDSPSDYLTFLKDYEDHKQMLQEIKHELAS